MFFIPLALLIYWFTCINQCLTLARPVDGGSTGLMTSSCDFLLLIDALLLDSVTYVTEISCGSGSIVKQASIITCCGECVGMALGPIGAWPSMHVRPMCGQVILGERKG